MQDPLSAMDATVSTNAKDTIRSSDSSVPSKLSSDCQARNNMPPSDLKRCQKTTNNGIFCNGQSAQSTEDSATPNTRLNDSNFRDFHRSELSGSEFENVCNTNSNTKLNHYHKIHKNVRNRARKFDSDKPSAHAFLGGLFTDLTASEDTLLLENGEVHQVCERSKLASNDPTIKMPSIFDSITNVNKNSALMHDSKATGAISKNARPLKKSVSLKSPAKNNVSRNDPVIPTSAEKEGGLDRQGSFYSRHDSAVVGNRSPNDQIGVDKQYSSAAKGKKGPQVSICCHEVNYGVQFLDRLYVMAMSLW